MSRLTFFLRRAVQFPSSSSSIFTSLKTTILDGGPRIQAPKIMGFSSVVNTTIKDVESLAAVHYKLGFYSYRTAETITLEETCGKAIKIGITKKTVSTESSKHEDFAMIKKVLIANLIPAGSMANFYVPPLTPLNDHYQALILIPHPLNPHFLSPQGLHSFLLEISSFISNEELFYFDLDNYVPPSKLLSMIITTGTDEYLSGDWQSWLNESGTFEAFFFNGLKSYGKTMMECLRAVRNYNVHGGERLYPPYAMTCGERALRSYRRVPQLYIDLFNFVRRNKEIEKLMHPIVKEEMARRGRFYGF